MKVFDNLYFLGQTEFSAWAITTSQGIILLDAIFDYSIEDEVVGGLKKLGLDPAADQVRDGEPRPPRSRRRREVPAGEIRRAAAHVGADYDLLDRDNPSWKPKRDMVVTDGMKLTLGDTTMTLLHHARPHRRAPSRPSFRCATARAARGGRVGRDAASTSGRFRPRLEAYAASAERFSEIAAKAAPTSSCRTTRSTTAARPSCRRCWRANRGQPIPMSSGPQSVQRYLTTVGECAQAAVAGLPPN